MPGVEAKDALAVYHGRASVMQRVQLGIDEKVLDTQTKVLRHDHESKASCCLL